MPEKDHEETAIYCHLTCIKIKGRRPAKRISALLTDVYKKDKHNKFTSKFVGGPIPLHRQYECVNNEYFCAFPTLRGDGIVFDLARLSRTKKGSNSKLELELRTHVNLPRTIFKLQEQGEIIATVMAVSDETVSKKQHIKIRWNGEWPESEDNIQNCLKFEEISDETLENLNQCTTNVSS
ncbi:MAG: hypothetical protein MRK02_11615 [Candidatus Scalindua sp.]|nr:hypothetical protein [Candidatus Scalindua sp.]